MIDIDQMKRHCESVPEDRWGGRIVCFGIEKMNALFERLEVAERDAARYRWLANPDNSDGPHYLACMADDVLAAKIDEELRGMAK